MIRYLSRLSFSEVMVHFKFHTIYHAMEVSAVMKTKRFLIVVICLSIMGMVPHCLADPEPQVGGVLRIIESVGGTVIGYFPEMGPNDGAMVMPGNESMLNLNEKRQIEPQLAESFSVDLGQRTLTFKIRKGVQFHDGSVMNAKVAAWNYNLYVEKKKLPFSEQVESVEVVDEDTMVLHFKEYNNQMLWAFGWVPMYSQAAYEKNGVEWCRKNFVGTGPFKVKEWKRDAYLKWEKNENYWQKGKPYLDGIEVVYIPDPITASQMMQAKQADLWRTPPVREQNTLARQGMVRKSYWPGLPGIIYLNLTNPKAPTADPKVREAIEYAIDKPTIAKALGMGYYEPIYLFHPPGNWAHDPSYQPRTYNPEKARQLLAEAGYANGLKLKLLTFGSYGGGKDAAEAIKRYMDAAGFEVQVDIADLGRYFSAMFGKGWDDMLLSFNGTEYNSLASFQSWYGHHPRSTLGSFKLPDDLLALSKKSVTLTDETEQKEMTRLLSRRMAEEALFVPLMHIPGAYLTQPWVHTNFLECGLGRWRTEDMWMEKHK